MAERAETNEAVADQLQDLTVDDARELEVKTSSMSLCSTEDGEDDTHDGGFIPFPIHTEMYLFDPAVLKGIGPGFPLGHYRPVAGNEHLVLRPLKSSDFRRGYMDLISQLSLAGDTDEAKFHRAVKAMKRCPDTYYVYVLEDPHDTKLPHRVIATGTFLLEQKFLRSCSKRGMLEDLVVCDSFRGKQLGKFMVAVSEHLGREMHVYKLTLTCRDEMKPFYSKLGFTAEPQNDNYMNMRFDKAPNPRMKM